MSMNWEADRLDEVVKIVLFGSLAVPLGWQSAGTVREIIRVG